MCSNSMAGSHGILKGGGQSGRKVVPHDSKSDLPLIVLYIFNDPFL